MAASFPSSVPTTAQLYGNLYNNLSTLLDGDIGTSNATINVDDTTNFPTAGFITIDTEAISYTGTTGTSFTGCTRGADNTTAATHTDESTVNHYWVAEHHNRNVEEVIAIAQNLNDRIGLGTTQLKGVNGTVTNPTFSWANDTASGLYLAAVSNPAMAVNAVKTTEWKTTGFYTINGTVTNPAQSWINDTGSGLYLIAVSNPGMAVNSVLNTQWKTIGFGIMDGTVTNPGLFWNDDGDLGAYRIGANQGGFTANATKSFEWKSTGIGFINGTVTNPSIYAASDPNSGLYLIAVSNIGMSINGAQITEWTTTGIGIQSGTVTNPGLFFSDDSSTGIYQSASDFRISTGGTIGFRVTSSQRSQFSAGTVTNPSISFLTDDDTGIYLGATNDMRFATNGTLRFRFNSAGNMMPNGGGNNSIGDASDYLNDVSYKTLTDRGCLGYFDDGVELRDGSIVTDTEALLRIKKHPFKQTIYGRPMLDYKSFPKASYKIAENENGLLKRDENDEPIGGEDGIEMTSMFSIMIGAIKELTNRIKEIEGKAA